MFLAVRVIWADTIELLVLVMEQGGFEPEMVFNSGVKAISALNELTEVIIAPGRVAEIGGFGLAVFENRVQEGDNIRHICLQA